MLDQEMRARGIKDERVLRALRIVPRERFVPKKYEKQAYEDTPLPIGFGQTISQPYIVAVMAELLQLNETSVVLEIGTGSGYQAAVLSEIANKVYSVEIIETLADEAVQRLAETGFTGIEIKHADGYYGWIEAGPFDGVVVSAAVAQVPPQLVEQLKPKGRMVIPIGSADLVQNLTLVEKKPDGSTCERQVMSVRFVPFTRTLQRP